MESRIRAIDWYRNRWI